MIALFIILTVLLALSAVLVPVVYTQVRNRIREDKNIERGLKMVPLLIHLPPPSEDTEAAGRDVRDLIDENISKAQVIYNIIASTLKKGHKVRLHGQRHFSFEIVGTEGFVHFYAAVPLVLVDVVKQAVVSAYPSARLEEVADHNIFSPTGKIAGTVGGELVLKEPYAYPIATYQDIKRDPMQALLNALSALEKEDGATIQLLMRPADPAWRKEALAKAAAKRKGSGGGSKIDEDILQLIRDFFTAFVRPPEGKKGDKESKDISGLDQAIVDSIEDKTRHPGYETLIRVAVSSSAGKRAEAMLNNIVAAFSLFDAPGKNGFKYTPADDIESLVTDYVLRIFPQSQTETVLNSVELATIFHFPDQRSIPTSQLERQGSKQVDAPRNMPDTGLLLGYNIYRGVKKPIRLDLGDRQRHMYAVGQTGTGKSTFLENLALQDMISGGGFAFIDPHGDTAEQLLSMVPRERTEDVIYFSPADTDYPLGLNLFEYQTSDQKDFIIQEVMNMLYKLYDPQRQGIVGPRYEHMFRNAALAIMADPNGGTFIDIPKLFRDPQYVQQKLQHVKDQNVLEFWQKEMPQSQRSNDFGEVVSWFVSKFGAFLSNEMMRNIIGQTKSAFDLRDVMDNGKILLVNLSKGRLGELNSKLLGMIFVMKFQAAAMSRANIPEDERRDFALYVDEFQNFSTDSFATIMSEARKYHLNLIVANQFTTQLTEEIRDAVFGNMGTIVAFRIGQPDVEALSKYFQPYFDGNDLLRIPNHNTIIRTLVKGVPTQPFSMATLPPLGKPNAQLSAALKQLSAAKYGKPKSVVEAEVFERLATKPASAPSFGQSQPARGVSGSGAGFGTQPSGASGAQPAGSRPSAPRSFLEDWLHNKDKPLTVRPSPWSKGGTASASPPVPAKDFPNTDTSALSGKPAATGVQTHAPASTWQFPPAPDRTTMPPAMPAQPASAANQPHAEVSAPFASEPAASTSSRGEASSLSSPPSTRSQDTLATESPAEGETSGELHIRNGAVDSQHIVSIDRDGNLRHQ